MPQRSKVSTRGSAQIENVATRGALQGIEGWRWSGGGEVKNFIFDQEVNRPDVGVSSQVERETFELNGICEMILFFIFYFFCKRNLFAFVAVVVFLSVQAGK